MKNAKQMILAVAFALLAADQALADGLPEQPAARVAAAAEPSANFQIKVGASGVLWQDSNKGVFVNGDRLDGASAHLDDVWVPTAALTYYFSKNFAAELFCCFAHASVYGTGTLRALGQDKVADTWAFPPALTLQYHFDSFGAVRPYVGAGVQWVHYFDSDSDLRGALGGFDRVDFRDSWGPVAQAGFDVDLGRGWSLGLDVKYTWADTRLTWNDGAGDTITTRHEIDPLIVTANIGYRFNLDGLFAGGAW